jgi:signal transduction histidine kinase
MQRPRRGALGLRGRIVGAVLVTTVATLGVAALALLGPLETQLRKAELSTLVKDARGANLSQVDVTGVEVNRSPQQAQLARTIRGLAGRLGAQEVSLLAYPQVLLATSDQLSANEDKFSDVARAFRTGRIVQGFGSDESADVATVAIPIAIGAKKIGTSGELATHTYVLAVRKNVTEVADAVRQVTRAFTTAAIAGLALTLILGMGLAATLVRRLRRLRQAALRLAEVGPPVEVPTDRARDEVGDLTRTFATMQRRLQQQEEARRAFVATASHELRTPLASLDGMLELIDDDLRAGEPDIEDARELLQRARAQSHRLGRLAADLLDLSRLDAEVQLRSEPVELGELSRAVLAEFELGTSERGITTTLDDTTGPVWALGDPGSVARIIRILLDNAVRATPPRSEVKVELQNGDGPVAISVSDAGPGVSAAERELIFERFHRGRGAGMQAGFGLGLAIGRELAERMGGQLVLEEPSGPGATFTLELPAATAPPQLAASS